MMPVIIVPAHYDYWLDARINEPKEIMEFQESGISESMDAYPASMFVNDPKNEGEQCIRPAYVNR